MLNLRYIQCIPLYKEQVVFRAIENLKKLKCEVLLDLEDGVQNVMVPSNESNLKEQARESLRRLLYLIKDLNNDYTISIRINALNTADFKNDIPALNLHEFKWKAIFIPKIESSQDINSILEVLRDQNVKFKEIVPIFESQKAIGTADQILSKDYSGFLKYVFFGHYDYNLDCNNYPIMEQNTSNYWDLLKSFIPKLEKYNVCYGNSPYTRLNDSHGFNRILSNLDSICKLPFGQISLHLSQTKICYNRNNHKDDEKCNLSFFKTDENYDAPAIIKLFEKHHLKGRSFALIPGTNFIITPQEYQLAINSLKNDKCN